MKPNVVVCLYHLVLCSESGRELLLFVWVTPLSLLLKPHCEQKNKRIKKYIYIHNNNKNNIENHLQSKEICGN